MTFREKLAQEHPQQLNRTAMGGCDGCPCEYGYEKEYDCGGGSYLMCERCWNREMPETPAPMTAEEAWELVQRLDGPMKPNEALKFYDFLEVKSFGEILHKYTPQQAKEMLEEWESKNIHVGDVVYCFADCDDDGWRNNEENYGVVTGIYPNTYHVLMKNGDCADFKKDELEKTGKHIDIQSVLDQIGGGKHD